MRLFRLITAPVLFTVSGIISRVHDSKDHLCCSQNTLEPLVPGYLSARVLSFAQSNSILNPFNIIASKCCQLENPTHIIPPRNMSSLNCPQPHYPFNLTIDASLCVNHTSAELKQCFSAEALNRNIIIQSLTRMNNTIYISYTYNCKTYTLYSIFVVIVFLVLFFIITIILVAIFCVIMQNQRKRKLHLRGIACPQANIVTVENGMEHTNKRPGLNNADYSEETHIQSGNSNTDPFPFRYITVPSNPLRLPIEENCYSFNLDFTEPSPAFTYEPLNLHITKKFDISPPRSPAPVGKQSSVFTFDLPDRLDQELSSIVTPTNLIDDLAPFPSFSRTESLFPNGSVNSPLDYFQRSQSAVVSSNDMDSQQLCSRRGIQLKLDLTYETQSDVCSNQQSLNLSRRINSEQLVQILINEEDLSTEYSNVPMNKDKVAIPGTGHKNRYADILPNRCSRVILQETNSDVITTYINANHISSQDKKKSYIAAQGPLKHTVDDFWRMVVENNTSIIVMITTLEEIEQSRCYKYWPQNGQTECYGRTKVTFVSQKKGLDYVKTYFKVSLTQSLHYKHVTHYRYTTWPDHGVPSSPNPILKLIREVNDTMVDTSAPIVIHCSAGVGRTGCYIAIDIGQDQLTKSSSVDILGTLCSMRRDRGTMIQTFDQYLFVYHALSHFSYSEKLVSSKLRIDYQRFIASMTSPVSGFPPRFYNSSNKYIDELTNNISVMDTTNNVPHHEILTTPSIHAESSDQRSFSFIEPQTQHSIHLPESNAGTFLFTQTTKPQNPTLPSPLLNLTDINLENANTNKTLSSFKAPQPLSFDFSLLPEEPPNPRKKNIPKRLTLPKSPDVPLSSPELLSCPVPSLTPTNFRETCEPSFFFPDQRTNIQCSSASYLSKDQSFNFPDPTRKLRSCEHTAFPFGNLTIRGNTPNDNFSFTFSDSNLGRGCAVPPTNEPTSFSSFTWPTGVKRMPVTSSSPITPRTPTLVH